MHANCCVFKTLIAQTGILFVNRAENQQSNFYTMAYNLLKGKKGIIFGALNDQSIAWKVAERAYEEGAEIVLTNAPIALRMGTINELAEKVKAEVISADATNLEDLENLMTKSMEILGGKVDFILHSIGMSPNVRKGIDYDALNYDYYHKNPGYFCFFAS